MKKLICFIVMLAISGCISAGSFSEKRNRLHEMGHEDTYCEQNPNRCVNGVPW